MSIFINGKKSANTEDLQWVEHPKFRGVFMKDILSGTDTDCRFSYHLVKIEPNCEIGEHIHKDKPELHEIIEGYGVATIQGHAVSYEAGVVSLIEGNLLHSVKAGEQGLLLRATFIPALN